MSYSEENPYQAYGMPTTVAHAGADTRADFIRKTYLHLAGAVAVFVGLIALWIQLGFAEPLMQTLFGSPWMWLIVLGAFMFVSYIANKWALNAVSPGQQYAGLGLFVFAESIIFTPLIYLAFLMESQVGPIVMPAAVTTVAIFAALTAIVFFTAKDFSFLRTALMIGGFVAMGLIVVSLIMGFQLGILFIGAMILFCCGYILYDTSNVLHHYRVGQHVAASLALFASVALLFWYILQLFMRLSGDD